MATGKSRKKLTAQQLAALTARLEAQLRAIKQAATVTNLLAVHTDRHFPSKAKRAQKILTALAALNAQPPPSNTKEGFAALKKMAALAGRATTLLNGTDNPMVCELSERQNIIMYRTYPYPVGSPCHWCCNGGRWQTLAQHQANQEVKLCNQDYCP